MDLDLDRNSALVLLAVGAALVWAALRRRTTVNIWSGSSVVPPAVNAILVPDFNGPGSCGAGATSLTGCGDIVSGPNWNDYCTQNPGDPVCSGLVAVPLDPGAALPGNTPGATLTPAQLTP